MQTAKCSKLWEHDCYNFVSVAEIHSINKVWKNEGILHSLQCAMVIISVTDVSSQNKGDGKWVTKAR